MHISFQKIDCGFANAEKVLNVLGWIPIVSTVSGSIRLAAGKVQAVAFGILAVATLAMGNIVDDPIWIDRGKYFTEYALHGLTNCVRGYVEMAAYIGNLAVFLYDSNITNRWNYPQEKIASEHLLKRMVQPLSKALNQTT